jgi:hypothetical protein
VPLQLQLATLRSRLALLLKRLFVRGLEPTLLCLHPPCAVFFVALKYMEGRPELILPFFQVRPAASLPPEQCASCGGSRLPVPVHWSGLQNYKTV